MWPLKPFLQWLREYLRRLKPDNNILAITRISLTLSMVEWTAWNSGTEQYCASLCSIRKHSDSFVCIMLGAGLTLERLMVSGDILWK